jgi:quercetin dioxygenase-like cupin family protein
MSSDLKIRRTLLQGLAALPFLPLVAPPGEALAQAGGPLKVNTQGLVAKIKFEAPLGGFLTEINGKYKLRITELTLAPGGHVGEHNHVGPGIRQVTSGYMTYVAAERDDCLRTGRFLF